MYELEEILERIFGGTCMTKEMTCIICPRGCTLKVELEDKKIISVTGNGCPRGVKYAEDECINPQRTVTSTVRCENGAMLSVKTSKAIPKEKMQECMEKINSFTATLPVRIGDVLIPDVFGADIIATQNKKA